MMRMVCPALTLATVVALSGVACESGGKTTPGQAPLASNGDAPATDSPRADGDGRENGVTAAPPVAPAEPSGDSAESNPALNGGVSSSGSEDASEADETGAGVDEVAGVVDPVDDVAPGGMPSAPTFHVFLLLGQSNMAGYPKAQPADRTEDPRVKVLGFDDCAATGRVTDQWDVAAPPLHECWNDGLGPGDYFAKSLLDVIPEGDSIGLVPCAISGERIEPFLKVGGARYDDIIRRARMAQEAGGVIEGILFHQGESNTGDPTWPGKVNTLVTDLRADLALGEAPFLAGELLYSGGSAGHNVLVNQLPSLISNAFVISANGLVVDPADTQWNLHFGHDSVVEFGERYAQAMVAALGW